MSVVATSNLTGLPHKRRLQPDHLKDLAKSGLTAETIQANGIHSVRPGDIKTYIGYEPDGLESALGFPYRSLLNGESGPFTRVKVFPPLPDREGMAHQRIENYGIIGNMYAGLGGSERIDRLVLFPPLRLAEYFCRDL